MPKSLCKVVLHEGVTRRSYGRVVGRVSREVYLDLYQYITVQPTTDTSQASETLMKALAKNYREVHNQMMQKTEHARTRGALSGGRLFLEKLDPDGVIIQTKNTPTQEDPDLRDLDLNPLPKNNYFRRYFNFRSAAAEVYSFELIEEDDGKLTLTMHIPKRINPNEGLIGIEILKRYAVELRSALAVTKNGEQIYPDININITGAGAQKSYDKRSINYQDDKAVFQWCSFAALVGVGLLIGAAFMLAATNPLGWILFGVGLPIALFAGGVAYFSRKEMLKVPKRDLAWHQKDLQEQYKADDRLKAEFANVKEPAPTVDKPNTKFSAEADSTPAVTFSRPASLSSPPPPLRPSDLPEFPPTPTSDTPPKLPSKKKRK